MDGADRSEIATDVRLNRAAPGRPGDLRIGNGEVSMLTVLAVLLAWIVLQWWVLPRLGVPT
jgi:hypothetical protein